MSRPILVACRTLCFVILAAVAGVGPGCGGRGQGQLETAPVQGLVTYQGKALARGMVTFIPESTGEGVRNASAMLDAKGRYRLTTYTNGDGAILGKHRVVVVAQEEVPPEMGKKMGPQGLEVPAREPKSLIPKRYATPDASGLAAEVKRGKNQFNFELKE